MSYIQQRPASTGRRDEANGIVREGQLSYTTTFCTPIASLPPALQVQDDADVLAFGIAAQFLTEAHRFLQGEQP